MNLRDENFYDFIRQFAGKKVAALLSFQECNSVDSFLGCQDVTAILHLESDELIDLKKNMCITLSNGSIYLLPGIESSIMHLTKLFKNKQEELIKQSKRRQSITISSVSSTPNIISNNLSPKTVVLGNSSIHQSTSNALPNSYLTVSPPATHVLANEIKSRISNTIIEWFKHNKDKLSLINIDFNEGSDFQVELNNNQEGIIVRCKCGTTSAIGQKQGVLMVRNMCFSSL
ncbi:unnamed protein product [Rotaria socialis]|nr:unnamed protein product [Rotaria socialis]